MPAAKDNDRTYLREAERSALQAILEEWNNKPDKKSRDAFVSGIAVPQIQQLNEQEFGPEVISKDKVAKVQWEKRVSVSHWTSVFAWDLHFPAGCLHLVQEPQAIQGSAGLQNGKEDPSPAGCRKGQGDRDRRANTD